MADTIFVTALIAYLVLATTLLFRSPDYGWGFPMFVLLYPIFLIACFFVSTGVVLIVWLGLALANMAIQFVYLKSAGVKKGPVVSVLVASLFLWPVQFAAAVNSAQTEKEEHDNREAHREKLGALPATAKGTVSYTHHHGTEEGHDSVWLEEHGDLSFLTDSRTFDQIGIAEGQVVSLTIDERDSPLDDGKVLWIVDGESGGPP